MGTFVSYLITYFIGGVTLIPLILILIWYSSEKVPETIEQRNLQDKEQAEANSIANGKPKGYRDLKAGEFEDNENSGLKTSYSGWITVTKEFYMFTQINPNDFISNTLNSDTLEASTQNSANNLGNGPFNAGGGGLFQKIIKGTSSNSNSNADDEVKDDGNQDAISLGAAKLKQLRKRNRFYGVIKHGNLFLYSDETQKNTKFAVSLEKYIVNIWPRNLTDAQLFTKRSAICLIKKSEFFKSKEKIEQLISILKNESTIKSLPKSTYYLYGDTSTEKEDWYFTLLKATSKTTDLSSIDYNNFEHYLNPSIMAKPLYYNTADMLDLIENLNATENQLTTKWINALIGRLFLATYRTEEFKMAFTTKIEQKLKKIRTPGFLDQLQIHRTDVGHSAPMFTNPKLKNLSPNGELEITLDFLYQGKLMLEIGTKLFINIGVAFKQRQFDIIMKLTVNKIEGELLLKIKPQPSSRLWYTFTKMPEIDLSIEPVLSSRSVNFGIITGILESKFKDAIKTSLVYPFYDDFVFYKSPTELFKAGIFDKSVRKSDLNNVEIGLSKIFPENVESINSVIENDQFTESESIELSTASVESKIAITTSINKHSENNKSNLKSNIIPNSEEVEKEIATNIETTYNISEQAKGSVLKSYGKIKQWYKKAPPSTDLGSSGSITVSTAGKKNSALKDLNYTPPEMISNRRKKTLKSESQPIDTQNETLSTNGSFQLLSSNINNRPSGEAFINLERKRGGSRSSRFGSISSIDENGLSSQQNLTSSPVSPEMFINKKFKSPTTTSTNSGTAEFGSTKNHIVKPQVLTFTSSMEDKNISPNSATKLDLMPPELQESPLPQESKPEFSHGKIIFPKSVNVLNQDVLNLHERRSLERKPPPLPAKDTKMERRDSADSVDGIA